MAWFQNLAGRAEDLLNKIDNNAATVLSQNSPRTETDETDTLLSVSCGDEAFGGAVAPMPYEMLEFLGNENKLKIKPDPDEDLASVSSKSQTKNEEHYLGITNEASDIEKDAGSRSDSLHSSFIYSEEAQDYTERIEKVELENQELNSEVLKLRHLCSELGNENENLQSQIKVANYLVQEAQSEMEQYKARAQRILMARKEELKTVENPNVPERESSDLLNNYTEELKRQVEFHEMKNFELSETVRKLTQDLSFLQQQLLNTQRSSQDSIRALQTSLEHDKKNRLAVEEECRVKSQELQQKIQEAVQQHEIIRNKNLEIDNLKKAFKQISSDTNVDYEHRIKTLTNALMFKQNALETVTTERNALKLQLEKLENEYHQNLTQLERAQVRVNVNDTDDVKSQVPQFLRLSPLDAGVTRRVKTAYSSLNTLSVRTGIFLRRYPLARVLVFCYMVLLHFWVLLVLFTSAPNSP